MEVSGQLYFPAALPLGKEPPVSIWQEARWAPHPIGSGGEEKNLIIIPAGSRIPVVQPVD